MVATDSTTGTTVADPTERAVIAVRYAKYLDEIPWAADDDGTGIINELLQAENWEDLNREAKLPKLETFVGKSLKVLSVERRESDIEGGMPFYLELQCEYGDAKTPVKVQTSAASPMVKLTMLHHFHNLPAVITVTQATKATKRGMYPLDITVNVVTKAPGRA